MELEDESLDHILIDYLVPIKGQGTLKPKTVNWPKGFYVNSLRPALKGGAT